MNPFSRSRKRSGAVVFAAEGDLHGNSTVGVNPLTVVRGDGSEWVAGDWGQWVKQKRDLFWDWIWALGKEYRAEVWGLANGDLLDDPYHPTTKVVSQNEAVIVGIGEGNYERVRGMCEHLFVLGGTDAHAHVDHALEELLAARIEATPDEEAGTFAWTHWLGEVSGVLIDACHHAETYGFRPWTERSAAVRQSEILRDRYVEMGQRVPDLAFRAHGHYPADSGITKKPRTIYQYAWQLTNGTTFGKRRGSSYHFRPVGGFVAICKDGEYFLDHRFWQHEGREPWTPS